MKKIIVICGSVLLAVLVIGGLSWKFDHRTGKISSTATSTLQTAYEYYVTFSGSKGLGAVPLSVGKMIDSGSDIVDMTSYIRQQTADNSIIVLNWTLVDSFSTTTPIVQ